MAFLKGLSAEDMEVRIVEELTLPSDYTKPWQRGIFKQIQSELKLERMDNTLDYDPVG